MSRTDVVQGWLLAVAVVTAVGTAAPAQADECGSVMTFGHRGSGECRREGFGTQSCDLGYGPDLFYYLRRDPEQDNFSTFGTISVQGGVVDRFGVGENFDALTFVADLPYGPNLFYYLRHDPAEFDFSTIGAISADGAVTDLFEVGFNFDALAYVAEDLGYGPNLFYYLRHDPEQGNLSTFGTISVQGEVIDRFGVGDNFDALTYVAEDLGYGPNLFYYLRHDPEQGNLSTFGTISVQGEVIDRFGVGDNFDALTYVTEDLGYGPSYFYYLRHDPEQGNLSTFGTISVQGEVIDRFGVGTAFNALTFAVCPAPELAFDPSTLDFGDLEVGTTSPTQTATLANTGDATATGLEFSELGGSGFVAETSACGDTLPAGEGCEVVVTFAPDFVGGYTGILHVTSAEGASTSLGLTGFGLGEALVPVGLTVDGIPLLSDANLVFEPGECVEVAPAWLWFGSFNAFLEGDAQNFTGPEGPAYDLILDGASYGGVSPGEIADCRTTGLCYQVQIGPSGITRPAAHWDATLAESLFNSDFGGGGGEPQTWALHLGESFADVPRSSPFYRSIETLLHNGVTGGCTDSEYCPAGTSNRGQMPVFMLKALEGAEYVPPACDADEGVFADVPAASPFCRWIEELANRGVAAGCGGGNYCPGDPVTRAQMAVLLLRTLEGASYTPPPCQGLFTDVTCPSVFAAWIEELYNREIISGCGAEPLAYCPATLVSRAQMAVFVTRTFGLALYGP